MTPVPIMWLCETFKLGEPLSSPLHVVGGFLHALFYLKTTTGEYAIKCLNKQSTLNFQNDLLPPEKSESIAAFMQKEGIATVTALRHDQHYLSHMDDKEFLVYPWVQGETLQSHQIETHHCKLIGNVLAGIHNVKLTDNFAKPKWQGLHQKDWHALLQPVLMSTDIAMDRLRESIHDLILWSKEARLATSVMQSDLIFSHRDLDPRNVLWTSPSTPIVLDWEYAGLIHPTLDVLIVALNWSNVLTGKINKNHFIEVVQGFIEKSPHLQPLNSTVIAGYKGYCLEWLIYNLKQFATTKDSAILSAINQSLLALYAVHNQQSQLCDWFNSCI